MISSEYPKLLIKQKSKKHIAHLHSDFIPIKINSKVFAIIHVGAKEVFKKVSHAYSILIDPEKKAHYDRYGPEEDHPRPSSRRANPQEDF